MRCSTAITCMALWLLACEADHPCDKDQTYKQGICEPNTPAAQDAGKDSGEAYAGDAGKCQADQAASLWADCKDDSGCNCAAPFCAVMPGAAMGYCTVHCDPSKSDCPGGGKCFDVSQFGVTGIDPFCLKP